MTETATDLPKLTPDEVVAQQRARLLTVISVILLVLAMLTATHNLFFANRKHTLETADLAVFKVEDVARVEISSAGTPEKPNPSVTLLKRGDTWQVANRYGARADQESVQGLIERVVATRYLKRAALSDQAGYVTMQVTEDTGARLKLFDGAGKELLHVIVGTGASDSADVFRFAHTDAPEGMFTGEDSGGGRDNIRSKLQLSAANQVDPVAWLDLSSVQMLPRGYEMTKLTIRRLKKDPAKPDDPGVEELIEIESGRDPNNPENRLFKMLKPAEGRGSAATIEGALSALTGARPADVAGRVPNDATALGVADAAQWVKIDYIDNEDAMTNKSVHAAFGVQKDGNVAVLVSSQSRGEFIYWLPDYVLGRVFRDARDFTEVPPVTVQHILISFDGADRAKPKQPRTKEQAKLLAEDILVRARQPGADWTALQVEYNEDSQPHNDYEVTPTAGLVQPFKDLAMKLKVDELDIVESQFGYHVMKRIK